MLAYVRIWNALAFLVARRVHACAESIIGWQVPDSTIGGVTDRGHWADDTPPPGACLVATRVGKARLRVFGASRE
jgi:hypothetical protein